MDAVTPEALPPTLPALPAVVAGASDRAALLAGLTFMDGAAEGWAAQELVAWFTAHAGAMGRERPPAVVSDVALGTFALAPEVEAPSGQAPLPKLLGMARQRVIAALRGLLARPSDDRFLQAAIFAGRVHRKRRGRVSVWAACPDDEDHLSDIVLSLFSVDVLTYREFYEENLCVCDVCGRLSWSPMATTRTGCVDHIPSRESGSRVSIEKLLASSERD